MALRIAKGLVLAFGTLLTLAVAMLSVNLARVRAGETGAPPPPAHGRLVATPLGRVFVSSWGDAAAPPVLIVPGTAAWGGFWRDAAARLARRGWRVNVVDLPPFGYSDRDPQARYDRPAQARRLAAVLDGVAGARRTILVGHSFGAGAATELALRAPGRLRSLVLVDAALGKPDASDPAPARLLRWGWLARITTAASITNPRALQPLLEGFLNRKGAAAPWIPVLRRPMARPGTTDAYAAWLPQLFATDDGGLSRTAAGLAAIRAPVAILWGAEDETTPPAQGRRWQALLHARSFTLLRGVGHIPHVEDPDGFGRALAQAIEGDR